MQNTPNKLEQRLISLTNRAGFKLALFSASAMTILAGVIISPALPSIESHFHATPNATLLTKCIVTMPALFVMLFCATSRHFDR